jgi:hypothetical protein
LHLRGTDGKLVHHTLCENGFHLQGVRKQYFNEYISGSGLMAERKKNVKLWQRLKAAHAKKTSDYARKHGLSIDQASIEMEYFDMLDRELMAIIRQESEPYVVSSSEEE